MAMTIRTNIHLYTQFQHRRSQQPCKFPRTPPKYRTEDLALPMELGGVWQSVNHDNIPDTQTGMSPTAVSLVQRKERSRVSKGLNGSQLHRAEKSSHRTACCTRYRRPGLPCSAGPSHSSILNHIPPPRRPGCNIQHGCCKS